VKLSFSLLQIRRHLKNLFPEGFAGEAFGKKIRSKSPCCAASGATGAFAGNTIEIAARVDQTISGHKE